jgi:aspartate oxidase
MVFAARLAERLEEPTSGPSATGAMRAVLGRAGGIPVVACERTVIAPSTAEVAVPVAEARHDLQRAMTRGAGVVRSAASLATVAAPLAVAKAVAGTAEDAGSQELANLVTCAEALLTSAAAREESRGCHVREEFPEALEAWRLRIVLGGAS